MGSKLEIKREDGSTHWTEYFNNNDDALIWEAEERTRPYWNESFTVLISEDTQPDVSLLPVTTESIREARIAIGKQNRLACEMVLDLIGGWNSERELSVEDIFSMQTTLANADKALRVYMPKTAKQAIQAIIPDGELVTQEMKDDAILLLADY